MGEPFWASGGGSHSGGRAGLGGRGFARRTTGAGAGGGAGAGAWAGGCNEANDGGGASAGGAVNTAVDGSGPSSPFWARSAAAFDGQSGHAAKPPRMRSSSSSSSSSSSASSFISSFITAAVAAGRGVPAAETCRQ